MCQCFPAIQPRVGVSNSELVLLLLSYFVAQYVLTIVMQVFVKIYFNFREITFLVRSLKYANYHREYYPKGHNGNKPNLSARNNGYQHGEKPFSSLPGFFPITNQYRDYYL